MGLEPAVGERKARISIELLLLHSSFSGPTAPATHTDTRRAIDGSESMAGTPHKRRRSPQQSMPPPTEPKNAQVESAHSHVPHDEPSQPK